MSNSNVGKNSQILNKSIVVMKFGGSCFKDSKAFQQILDITIKYDKARKFYVCSAFNGITDKLVSIAEAAVDGDTHKILNMIKAIESIHLNVLNEIFEDSQDYIDKALKIIQSCFSEITEITEEIMEFGLEPYFLDNILSYGERLSTQMLDLYLDKKGYDTQFFAGEDLIITNDDFTNALPKLDRTKKRFENNIQPILENDKNNTIFCITGFIGRNKMGYTTTLGRGGTDFTATIVARIVHEMLHTKKVKVILWKDVSGILSADPRLVENPHLVHQMSYSEAKEMAFFGAKLLHPKCLSMIEEQEIIVEIRNFSILDDNADYSKISKTPNDKKIAGISAIEEMAMINVTNGALVDVPGVLGNIFSIMGENKINVSMVTQSSSEINTTFVIENKYGDKALKLLKEDPRLMQWSLINKQEVGIVAIIGENIHFSETKMLIFKALHSISVNPIAIAQSSDGINISIVVPSNKVKSVSNAINEEFASQ